MANELLEFEDGTLGIALNLDTREIGVVVLGDFSGIEEGQTVRRTGEILSVPVGDAYLGRVVDPLGNADRRPRRDRDRRAARARDCRPPRSCSARSVHEPMQTGIKAIDSLTPIGRGQRQLIIGDRQTGKTTIAIDTIINQKQAWDSGDPRAAGALHLRRHRPEGLDDRRRPRRRSRRPAALEYTTIVAAPASDCGRASSTSRPTPARPSASTGCTTASTS